MESRDRVAALDLLDTGRPAQRLLEPAELLSPTALDNLGHVRMRRYVGHWLRHRNPVLTHQSPDLLTSFYRATLHVVQSDRHRSIGVRVFRTARGPPPHGCRPGRATAQPTVRPTRRRLSAPPSLRPGVLAAWVLLPVERPSAAHQPLGQICVAGPADRNRATVAIGILPDAGHHPRSDKAGQFVRRLLSATKELAVIIVACLVALRGIDPQKPYARPVDLDRIAVDHEGLARELIRSCAARPGKRASDGQHRKSQPSQLGPSNQTAVPLAPRETPSSPGG